MNKFVDYIKKLLKLLIMLFLILFRVVFVVLVFDISVVIKNSVIKFVLMLNIGLCILKFYFCILFWLMV